VEEDEKGDNMPTISIKIDGQDGGAGQLVKSIQTSFDNLASSVKKIETATTRTAKNTSGSMNKVSASTDRATSSMANLGKTSIGSAFALQRVGMAINRFITQPLTISSRFHRDFPCNEKRIW